MDAEKQRTASEKEHLARSAAFTEAEARVKTLEKKLSRWEFFIACQGYILWISITFINNEKNYNPKIVFFKDVLRRF